MRIPEPKKYINNEQDIVGIKFHKEQKSTEQQQEKMIWYYSGASMLHNISFISIGCLLQMGVIVKMNISTLWNLQPQPKKKKEEMNISVYFF